MEKLREKVYELTAKQNEGIFKMSDQDLIEYVILPQIAKPTGPDTRGKCISDDFMELMADFGQELYKKMPSSAKCCSRLPCSVFLMAPSPTIPEQF